ncbi:hypothetical protein G5714_002983 [Onychostoma macrolepis]|uniref:Uncharacterized protein n=1 Tax=Onychostoma macrolepis TaxID=369639 RepID=A0A7J6D9B0_9TELE|nr:hypothetical protein G5714_002983 [Onychostoma macrolepis]
MAMQNYSAPGGIPMQGDRAYTAQPVIVSMPDQSLNDDIIFSTFNLRFCNPCCLGFVAFYNSIKARSYGTRARHLNITAVIIGSIISFVIIIIVAVKIYQAKSDYNHA